jgi:hypothetical protein
MEAANTAARNRHFVAGNFETRIRVVRNGKHHDAAPRRLRVTLRNRDASTPIGCGSTDENELEKRDFWRGLGTFG